MFKNIDCPVCIKFNQELRVNADKYFVLILSEKKVQFYSHIYQSELQTFSTHNCYLLVFSVKERRPSL